MGGWSDGLMFNGIRGLVGTCFSPAHIIFRTINQAPAIKRQTGSARGWGQRGFDFSTDTNIVDLCEFLCRNKEMLVLLKIA